MNGVKIMSSKIKYGFLGMIISGSVLSLELYGLDFLFSIKLLSQGEVSVTSVVDSITLFPVNVAFVISVAIFLTSLLILISGLKKQKN